MAETAASCACGSGTAFEECCLPYLKGKKKPVTAEALLRSRYTAFTRGEVNYILETHHSRTRKDVKRDEIEEWSKGSEWLGLQIVQSEAGQADDKEGKIAFCAKFKADGKEEEHWEQSFFEKEEGEWRFLDARGISVGTYRREEPKIGRNDVCPCGSGKKFKKCCGK